METNPHEEIAGVGDDRWDGADLCVSCLAELYDGCGQCHTCGAPVIPNMAMTPWESTLAEGFIYRRAIAEPQRLVVVAGVCAVFSYILIHGLWCLSYHAFVAPFVIPYVWFGGLEIMMGSAGIWQCVRNYRSRAVVSEGEP